MIGPQLGINQLEKRMKLLLGMSGSSLVNPRLVSKVLLSVVMDVPAMSQLNRK